MPPLFILMFTPSFVVRDSTDSGQTVADSTLWPTRHRAVQTNL